MELEAFEIPLEDLLRDSLNMVMENAMKHSISLTSHFLEIPATIRADERKIRQILYNLLSNAVKFTPDGGKVELKARELDGQLIRITVSDTGIGLTETDLERIFQPFEQGDNSASRKYQGPVWVYLWPNNWSNYTAVESGPPLKGKDQEPIFILLCRSGPIKCKTKLKLSKTSGRTQSVSGTGFFHVLRGHMDYFSIRSFLGSLASLMTFSVISSTGLSK
jgi:hypothetical protein